jgi:hypothetical protein
MPQTFGIYLCYFIKFFQFFDYELCEAPKDRETRKSLNSIIITATTKINATNSDSVNNLLENRAHLSLKKKLIFVL